MSKQKSSIASKYKELKDITQWFEEANIDNIDDAIKKFKAGSKLAKELKKEIETLENSIKKVEQDFS